MMISSSELILPEIKRGYRFGVRVLRWGRREKKGKWGVGKRNGARQVHVVGYRTMIPGNFRLEFDKWKSGGVYMCEL